MGEFRDMIEEQMREQEQAPPVAAAEQDDGPVRCAYCGRERTEADERAGPRNIVDIIVATGLMTKRTAIASLIKAGGVAINQQLVTDPDAEIASSHEHSHKLRFAPVYPVSAKQNVRLSVDLVH